MSIDPQAHGSRPRRITELSWRQRQRKRRRPPGLQKEVHVDRSKVELVAFGDATNGGPHILSLTTETKTLEMFREDGTRHLTSSEIEIVARYVSSPKVHLSGYQVSLMGGKTEYDNRVKLTNGGVTVDPSFCGLHIGSVLFGRIVDWAKQFPEDWRVVPITLSVVDARDPKNKARRNRFYEQFGFQFTYRAREGIADAEGRSDPAMTVKDLLPRNRWEGVSLLGNFDQALGKALQAGADRLDELEEAKRQIEIQRECANEHQRRHELLVRRIIWVLVGVAALGGVYLGRFFT